MSLFQPSVLKSHLILLNEVAVDKAYKKFQKYFHNIQIQENIKIAKEEQYQATFLNELFVNIFNYTLFPNPDSNLTTEFKNEMNSRKADGAILKDGAAIGVIELKGTNTKDLESIRKQAFDYKANHKGCVYVITSNFEKLRFYINDATEFEEFDLFTLSRKQFNLMYLCLHLDQILNNAPLKIKEASLAEEEEITKAFYKDYSVFKRELYRDLIKRNVKTVKQKLIESESDHDHEDMARLEKNVKLTLFKKSQKLIDRFLFIFFAEDRTLLPSNSTLQILNKWKDDWDFGDERALYGLFKQYFNFLDKGRKGTEKRAEIYAYNGGLFKPDSILDALEIDDELLYKYTLKLSNYDFDSQVDVNILGHIFENSLNEIESVNAEIEGGDFDKQTSKRKKDGVFYTPKYITKYIVENTVGKLCAEKKQELGFNEEEYFKGRKNRNKSTIATLVKILDDYRAWLLQITICDPACGSGAFLNQALDFLIKEHTYIDELKTKILGGGLQFPDIENTILENNIYGVDLNEESVEIAKLSLWLRTAQPRRKLNDLSSNIKCGNSLIDDKKVAGDKAFNWNTAFAKVFQPKDKKAYHITTAIHDSRTSDRMREYQVRERREAGTNPYPNVIYFTPEDDLLISKTIAEIVEENQLRLLAYNICADHIHLLLVCDVEEIPAIMQKIKGRTSYVHGQPEKDTAKLHGKKVHKGFNKGLKSLDTASTGENGETAKESNKEPRSLNITSTGESESQLHSKESKSVDTASTGESDDSSHNKGLRSLDISSTGESESQSHSKESKSVDTASTGESDDSSHNKGLKSLDIDNTNKGILSTEKDITPRKKKPLWTQKYSAPKEITSQEQLFNTVKYIKGNRRKHELPPHSAELTAIIEAMCSDYNEAFKTEYTGGFDVVIGNPPYVRAELLTDFIPYFEKNYNVFHPASDLFAYFYELGSNIINKKGLMGYISNTFDKTTAGKVLRDYLNNKTSFKEYIDFTEVQIFGGATTYPVIIILDKNPQTDNTFKFIKIPKSSQAITINIEVHDTINVLQESLDAGSWSFLSAEKLKLFQRLTSLENIKDVFGKSYRGLITGLNDAFIVQNSFPNSEHTKPIFEGKEIKKWNTQVATQSLILFESKWTNAEYPNLETEDEKLKTLSNSNPEIFNHLLPYIDRAKKRYDQGDYWWELRNCAYYDLFERPKIIFPNLQNSNKFCLDTEGTYVNAPAVFIPSDSRTLLCVLNSKVVWEFLKSICVVRSGGYIEVKPQYFEQIPLPELRNEEYFDEATDNIMKYVSDLQLLENSFQRYFKGTLQLDRLQRKLQNWHDLNFGDFIKELNKAIKATNKLRAKEDLEPIATLTKKDEFEWMELFEENKKKAQDLQSQITATEKEIDQMVYELYGLSEEEIKIVEES